MKDKAHVLHVIPSISLVHGGPSRAIRSMEKALAGSAWHCFTATTDDDGPGRHLACTLNHSVTDGPATRWFFHKNTEFYKVAWSFLPWVKHAVHRFDLIHIHALFSFTSTVAAWAARRAGVPYIIRPLGTLTNYGRTQRRPWLKRLSFKWIEGPLLRDAAAVHFTSLDEQREAAETGVSMRGVVIPLGIEASEAFDDVLVRTLFTDLEDANYLLYLSRIDPKKNIEGLLRAFAQCSAQFLYTKLLIAGNGTPGYVASLVALTTTLGLDKKVIWAGHIDGDLKASALAGAQLFVLPSYSENFGIAAAEALMAGVPCVLGNGVAISHDVVAANAGVAVQTDPASIAAGIMQVLSDPDVRATMAVNAAALAHGKYSAQAMSVKLVQLYSGLIKR
jgi:glycosyltransferase involved in cell wall biosynthesis